MAFTLQILHASDFEAGIPALQDAVGFSAVINGLKDDFANTVILSSGDNYIPGPFFSSASDRSLDSVLGSAGPGRADIAILNAIGIQASVFGNHEFDLGTATISSLIVPSGAYPGALFPYLSGNLNFSNDANLRGRVVADGQEASTIRGRIAQTSVITVNGEKIGLVAATTPTLASISSPGAGVVITPANSGDIDALAAIIQEDVNALKAQVPGLNKIILLAHLQQIDLELSLTSKLRDVDVIISGGSNTLLADSGDRLRSGDTVVNTYPLTRTDADGKPILVINTDGNYKYVGRLVLTFNDDGTIDTNSLNPAINGAYATDDAGVDAAFGSNVDTRTVADPQVVAITDALRTVIVANDSNIFGKTSVFLNGTRDSVRTEETNLGNLTADANLFIARQTDQTAVLSLKNGGGIRDNIGAISASSGSLNPNDVRRLPPPANPLAGKLEGDISQLDIANSLRFNNSLSLVTVTATQLKEIFERGVAGVRPGATPGSFPQVGGVSFSFDATRAARVAANNATAATVAGDRIRNLVITDADGDTTQVVVQNGQIVGDPSRTFRIVTLGFIADGGDDYPFPLFAAQNPTLLNRVNLPTEVAEQAAFAAYISTKFPGGNFVFNEADVTASRDFRIQNLASFADNVVSFAQRDFQFDTFNRTDFLLDGSSKLSGSSSTGALIVTTPTDDAANAPNGESGSSFFTDRLKVDGNSSFNARFTFNLQNVEGDGFTFIIKDEAVSKTGIAGGYLGYQLDTAGTTYKSIAIAFDTHQNRAGDFVAAPTFADTNDNSVSILRDGLISNRVATSVPTFDLNSGLDTFAWVEYNGATNLLQVFVSQSGIKPTTALVSTTIDLPSVVGPEVVFGFSAATGNFRNTQTINNFNINFSDNVVAIAAGDSPNLAVNGINQNVSGDARINIIDASQGQGNNRIFGDAGNDEILVNQFDFAQGGDGDDILDASAGSGNNQLFGDAGNDTLFGGVNDRLFGGDGNDTLFAGSSNGTLTGGAGADRFVIATAALPITANTISDFQVGIDRIEILGLTGVTSFANLTLTTQGGNTVVAALGTNLAILTGISTATASDFVFG